MSGVHIMSVACTKFGKRPESLLELLSEAARQAVGGNEVDALFVGSQNPEELAETGNLATALADSLGLAPRSAVRVENSSSSGSAVFEQAFHSIAAGRYRTVLVAAGEKMTHLPTGRITRVLAEVLSPLERSVGLTMASLAAILARAYMHRTGLTREELALVPVKNHDNGLLNPMAHFQKKITVEEVVASKLVADPLRIYDCAPISDGAAALLLASGPGQIEVAGIGHGTDLVALQHRESQDFLRATREAAKQAYGMAGLGPGDVDVAELHDAFSILELIDLEDMGFFQRDDVRTALRKGETSLSGSLPVNPSGGLKSRGHPVGATGLAQIVEIYHQLTGNAGKRQVDGARVGVTQNIGGFGCNNLVTILRRLG